VVDSHALLARLQVLKGQIDFKSDPWPKISDAAKDCVKRLLEMDASKRATSEQVGQGGNTLVGLRVQLLHLACAGPLAVPSANLHRCCHSSVFWAWLQHTAYICHDRLNARLGERRVQGIRWRLCFWIR
jgi:hypothetical protein